MNTINKDELVKNIKDLICFTERDIHSSIEPDLLLMHFGARAMLKTVLDMIEDMSKERSPIQKENVNNAT